jgi:FlaG/FlaF family flagellin (archaellin)
MRTAPKAEYENIIDYDSDDEYAAQYFDELAINFAFEIDIIKLIEFESDELFLTSFDEFRDIESLTSALADKAFQHRLISIDITNVSINESFNYISITDSRYDDIEFKDILVNCDAADRSTNDMRQFKALQRISDVALNKKTIESSIKFEIDNTLTLEFVELNTSLEIITFHIVEINTSFLVCLNDFDRLDIYFNNLINQIVSYEHTSMKRRHFVIRRYEHAFLL